VLIKTVEVLLRSVEQVTKWANLKIGALMHGDVVPVLQCDCAQWWKRT
jgi:hypothetical protein